jgi:transitional endoplasmic reticulum ATPase
MLSREEVQWQRAEAASVRAAGGQTITLRVVLASPIDLGSGLVRVHPHVAEILGAAEGDTLAVDRPRGVPATGALTTTASRSGFGRPGDIGVALVAGDQPASDPEDSRADLPRGVPTAGAIVADAQPAPDSNVSGPHHQPASDLRQPRVSLTASRLAAQRTQPQPRAEARARTQAAIAFARLVVDEDMPRGSAAIDGLLRRTTGVGLGEAVSLRVVPAAQALAIKAEAGGASLGLKSSQLAGLLEGLVAAPGSLVQAGRGQLLRVVGTTPDGPVVVDGRTVVQVEAVEAAFTDSGVWYEDVGGLDAELARVREIVELPLLRPELFQRLGVVPPKGVLLHGAPGTGKTLLARAVANECRANFLHMNGPDLMHKYYGESEQRLKQLFEDAAAQAPSIIFIDEIDAIAPKRAEVLGEVEKRVVAQFLALMDGFVNRGQVVVIGATNLPHALDPALRRPGRFDREIEIGQPGRSARLEILRIHTRSMPLASDVGLPSLADRTSGFVGADVEALCQEAGMAAIRRLAGVDSRLTTDDPRLEITSSDFAQAFHSVEPTAGRDVAREQGLQTFAAVGGYESLKRSLRTIFGRAGLARGVLLHGPSGVGKTLLARSLAGELQLPLIAVDGPLLYSKWLGESEKALADVFAKARHNAPCLLLLDQLEAIGDSRLEQMQRMVGQLLRELDALAAFPELALIAATNRPELIDTAVKRRFDYVFDVHLPGDEDREAILQRHAGFASQQLVHLTTGLTGADIAAAVRRARLLAIEREENITIQDVEESLCSITR